MTFGSPGSPKRDYSRLSKSEDGLVCSQPNASTATSLATRTNIAKLLRSVRIVEKISMKVNVKDPNCALIAMVLTLHQLKIAQSGRRRRRFNMSALRNAYPFRKPDGWLKPKCRLWSLEVRPMPLPLPPEESPNLLNVKHL